MTKVTASRTLNPLHFEDLEPHRFEDLIRQLAYGFRAWGRLEATGRLGGDEGTDIRGLEIVTSPTLPSFNETEEGEGEQSAPAIVAEREWRIQCKRYKTIGPKLMREIVAEAVPDPHQPPYGLIIAAACDASAQTMSAFHDARIQLGVVEGHLWTKAHLEDLLFHPENDHLLFAYFGISLGTRRRSRLQKVQSIISTKRKILRAFKKEAFGQKWYVDTLIRDVTDTHYPFDDEVPCYEEMVAPPWFPCGILWAQYNGLVVYRFSYKGWLMADGSWDLLPDSRTDNHLGSRFRNKQREKGDWESRRGVFELINKLDELVPENERVLIRQVRRIPYESIMEVDPMGDNLYDGPHLYCSYGGEAGPFVDTAFAYAVMRTYEPAKGLEFENRKPLFEELAQKQFNSDELKLLNFFQPQPLSKVSKKSKRPKRL